MRIKRLSISEALEEFRDGDFGFCGLAQPVEELEPRPIRGEFRSGPYEDPLKGPHLYAKDKASELRATIRAERRVTELAKADRISVNEAIELERLTRPRIHLRPLVFATSVFMYAMAYGVLPREDGQGKSLGSWTAGSRYDHLTEQACMSFRLSQGYRRNLRKLGAVEDREGYVHVLPASRFKPFMVAGELVSDSPVKPVAIVRARLGDLVPHWTQLPEVLRLGHGPSERPAGHSECCWHVRVPEAQHLAAREAWNTFGDLAPQAPRTSMQRRTKHLRRERRAQGLRA